MVKSHSHLNIVISLSKVFQSSLVLLTLAMSGSPSCDWTMVPNEILKMAKLVSVGDWQDG